MTSTADSVDLHAAGDSVEFDVKVVPGSSRTQIVGVLGSALKIAVSAPPEGGKANKQVIQLLAGVFGVRRADVKIARGDTQPHKRIRVQGMTKDAIRNQFAKALQRK